MAASARSAEARWPEWAQDPDAVHCDIARKKVAKDYRRCQRQLGRSLECLQMLKAMIAVCRGMMQGRLHGRICLKGRDIQRRAVIDSERTVNERKCQCAGDEERQDNATRLRGRGPVQSLAGPTVITLHRRTFSIRRRNDHRWTWQGRSGIVKRWTASARQPIRKEAKPCGCELPH